MFSLRNKLYLVSGAIFALLVVGCSSFGEKKSVTDEAALPVGYIAINPIALPPTVFRQGTYEETDVQQQQQQQRSPYITTPSVPPLLAKPETKVEEPNPNRGLPDSDLKVLTNNAARISLKEYSSKGEVRYLTSGVTSKNSYYSVTIDYIKYFAASVEVYLPLPYTTEEEGWLDQGNASLADAPQKMEKIQRQIRRIKDKRLVSVGLAIGVGLRAEANFYSTESGAQISDLVNIGASAQMRRISGTMSLQTLGIESKTISDGLPIPSELNTSSIQTALQAIASMKANIYDPSTFVVPHVVGLEVLTYPAGSKTQDIVVAIHAQKDGIMNQLANQLSGKIQFTYGR